MADEAGRDLPSFLTSVLDKTEYICQNDVAKELPRRMLTLSIIHCRDIGTSEVRSWINLQPLLRTSYHPHHIAVKPISSETAAKN